MSKATFVKSLFSWIGLAVFVFLLAIAWLLVAIAQMLWTTYIPFYIYLAYSLICSIDLMPLIQTEKFRNTKTVLQFAFVMAVLFLWFSPIDSRQPFLKDLASVKQGMTVAQVDSIMGKYMKGTNWPTPPNASISQPNSLTDLTDGSTHQTQNKNGELKIIGAITYRHSDEATYNSDWGVVSFKEGRVSRVEFLPD